MKKNKAKKDVTLSEAVVAARDFSRLRKSLVIFLTVMGLIVGGLIFVRGLDLIAAHIVMLVLLFISLGNGDDEINYSWVIFSVGFGVVASAFVNNWILLILYFVSFVVAVGLMNLFSYKIYLVLKAKGSKYPFKDSKKGEIPFSTLPKELYEGLKSTRLRDTGLIFKVSETYEISDEDLVKITKLLDVAKNLDSNGSNYSEFIDKMSEQMYEIGLRLNKEKYNKTEEEKEVASAVNEELMSQLKD